MSVTNPTLVDIRDEGTSQGRAVAINFTGAGVTASISGFVATVNIPGGGSGAAPTTVEVNLGSASWRGKFTVVDATVSLTSKINIWQAPGPYTGKGTRADEAEMDYISCIAVPGTGQFDVLWRTQTMLGTTYSEVRGLQPKTAVNTQHAAPPFLANLESKILGRVRGNVKFNYTVG